MRQPRPHLLLGLLALSGGACAAGAPANVLGATYRFASSSGESETLGATTDTDIRAWELSYEFLPFLGNGNLALSYLRREDELDVAGSPALQSDIARLQVRWYYGLSDGLAWYLAPGIGYAFSVDEDPSAPGVDYGGSLYYDAEAGLKWYLSDRFGVQGVANYAWLNASGDGATPDSDLRGFSAGAGVFVDF